MPSSAVLFDLYYTLVGWDAAAYLELFTGHLEVAPQRVQDALDSTRDARHLGACGDLDGDIAAILVALGEHPEPELIAEVEQLRKTFVFASVNLYPDSLPAIRALRQGGARVALVSNCSFDTPPLIERLELAREFDAIILSFEVGMVKPDPGIYEAALSSLGDISPEEALFVDDQPVFCDAARALGLDTRLIRRNSSGASEQEETNGHAVIASLAELLP
jgi:putative hydrolase of the HAD superfamily